MGPAKDFLKKVQKNRKKVLTNGNWRGIINKLTAADIKTDKKSADSTLKIEQHESLQDNLALVNFSRVFNKILCSKL